MKRVWIAALLMVICLGAYATDDLPVKSPAGNYRLVTWDWTSTSDGSATGVTVTELPGILFKAVTVPADGDDAPEADYDITVKEVYEVGNNEWTAVGTDRAAGELGNRSAADGEVVDLTTSSIKPTAGRLQIEVTNAGSANKGRLMLIVYALQFRSSSGTADFDPSDFNIEDFTSEGSAGYAPVVSSPGVLTMVDILLQSEFDGHCHITDTISGLDVSDDLNLTASRGAVLTGDDVAVPMFFEFTAAGIKPTTTGGCSAPALDANDNWGAAFTAGQYGFFEVPALPSTFDGTIDKLILVSEGSGTVNYAFATVIVGHGDAANTAYTVFGSPTNLSVAQTASQFTVVTDTSNFTNLLGASTNAGKHLKLRVTCSGASTFRGLYLEY